VYGAPPASLPRECLRTTAVIYVARGVYGEPESRLPRCLLSGHRIAPATG
jgi:hypothetical protein